MPHIGPLTHPELRSPSSTSLLQDTSLCSQLQSIGQLTNGFQILASFMIQSIVQLSNGFQILLSFQIQSIVQLDNGLGIILNSQKQSVGQLPNRLLDFSYTKQMILEVAVTDAVCRIVHFRIAGPANY
jgi:hypothetical protein